MRPLDDIPGRPALLWECGAEGCESGGERKLRGRGEGGVPALENKENNGR